MDHTRVNISTSQISCGVLQISRLDSDPEAVLYALANYLYHPSRGTPAAFVILSDVVGESNSHLLIKYCRTNWETSNCQALKGKRIPLINWYHSGRTDNPKTGNVIYVATGLINHEVFKLWYVKARAEKFKAV